MFIALDIFPCDESFDRAREPIKEQPTTFD